MGNWGNGGSINPVTGLAEFWFGGGWDTDEDGNAFDNDAQHGETDASAAEQADAQARENEAQNDAFGGRDDDDGGNDRPAQQPTPQRTQAPTVGTQPTNLSTSSGPSRRLGFRGERKRSLLNTKATRPESGDPYGRFDKSTNPVNNPTSPITEDDIVEQGRKEKNAYIQEQLNKHNNPTPNANGVADDLDAQEGYQDLSWTANNQAAENQLKVQENAFKSAADGDPAGYGDMAPVEAVINQQISLSDLIKSVPPIPRNKASWFAVGNRKQAWIEFNKKLYSNPYLTPQEKQAFQDIFGQEGGMVTNASGSAVAGILASTLQNLLDEGYYSSPTPNLTPSQLTIQQVQDVYETYFDDVFKALDGSRTLGSISDPGAAAVLADALFSHGTGAGTRAIQNALNTVRLGNPLGVDGVPGTGTISALNEAYSNPTTRSRFLEALSDTRWNLINSNSDIPQNEKEGWKNRIDHFRP